MGKTLRLNKDLTPYTPPAKTKSLPAPPMGRAFTMGEDSDLLADWAGSVDRYNDQLRSSIALIRRRARDLAENNPMVIRFLRLCETYVVGPDGINLIPKPLGNNGKIDKADARYLRDHWHLWGKLGSPTMCGQHSWRGMQAHSLLLFLRDGERIRRKVINRNNPFGISYQYLDPVLLDHTLNRSRIEGGNRIKNGVEVNQWDRPVAYHFIDSYDDFNLTSATHTRIPADEIDHWFIKEREGQTRGVTWLAPVGARQRMLDGFEWAAVVAARAAACKMGAYKMTPEAIVELGLEKKADGSYRQTLEPGQMDVMPAGYEFDSLDFNWPSNDGAEFSKSVKRSIASGLNVSYNTLNMDLDSVSWSGLRAAELQDREFYRLLQHHLIEHECQPTFDDWLPMYLDFYPTQLPARKIDKYRRVTWRGRGMPYVDPVKQQQAYKLGLENQTMTLTQILADDRGITIDELQEELQAELDTLGPMHPLLLNPKTNTPSAEGENDDPDSNSDD